MKKYILIITAILLSTFNSCDFLDIVPDEIPTEADAFADTRALERYMYSTYSFMPNPRHQTASLDLLTADEIVSSFEHETFANFPKGNYSASDPVVSYWNSLYQGIRQCYILLGNIDGVPGVTDDMKREYSSEATFLIAYYHWVLLRSYGPIIIMESLADINMPPDQYPGRTPYDDCVTWIANKFDEAIAMGLNEQQSGSYYGRATVSAAMALKARMYLYAASPLFNGGSSTFPNTDDVSNTYADFVDKEGVHLVATSYDASKWERAAQAALQAINHVESQGFSLYDNGEITANMPYPSDPVERKLRMTIIDRENNPEVIWADTRAESTYGLQNKSAPFGNSTSWNGIAPTLTILETFYTENGLPIDQDPAYNYDGRYDYSEQDNGLGVTLNLNQYREPRFNAWISYHNSYYEYNRDGQFRILTKFRQPDNCGIQSRTTNYSPTGYLTKKGQHPLNSQGGTSSGSTQHYPWPVIRLGELYLSYAEALIEVGGQSNLDIAKTYIDRIRTRAGIPTIDQAWGPLGVSLNQAKMREIVRQERSIELFLENHRFWDIRRWLLGTHYFNVRARGMTVSGATDAAFFRVAEVNFQRRFRSPMNYLMPLPINDLQNNVFLVQNPNY